MQTIPPLPPGSIVECHRCDRLLGRRPITGFEVPLACSVAVFLLLPPAVFMRLMDSTIKNLVFEESRLVSSVGTIYTEVWFPFAFGFLFTAFLFPAMRALFLILVLASLKFGWKLWQRGRIFRWSEELRIWAMTDVVVIAGAIAYFRAAIPADVALRVGASCYVTVAVLVWLADRTLDRRGIWNAIYPDSTTETHRHVAACGTCELSVVSRRPGDPCPRCGARLDQSLILRMAPIFGFLAAALPLTIPAYGAAVMVNDQLTAVLEHTVVGTVQLLADYGYWQFAVVVLIGGIFIPIVELIGMIWLALRVRFPSKEGLVLRTRVYRVMKRLVRWPMIIPFIAAIAAPIIDFRGIDDIVSGPGATPLFILIVLMMACVRLFQPRLMWTMAGEGR